MNCKKRKVCCELTGNFESSVKVASAKSALRKFGYNNDTSISCIALVVF